MTLTLDTWRAMVMAHTQQTARGQQSYRAWDMDWREHSEINIQLSASVHLCIQYNTGICWASSQTEQKLRGPHVARQKQLSVDICCQRSSSAANPPPLLSIDGTDGRTLNHFMTLTTNYADHITRQSPLPARSSQSLDQSI